MYAPCTEQETIEIGNAGHDCASSQCEGAALLIQTLARGLSIVGYRSLRIDYIFLTAILRSTELQESAEPAYMYDLHLFQEKYIESNNY